MPKRYQLYVQKLLPPQPKWLAQILGIQVLVCAPDYNLFGDIGLLPTVLLNYAVCILIEKLSRAGG